MQEVLDRSGGKVRLWPATLYGTLKRLLDENLIEESGDRPAPEIDDARRRYYQLTTDGAELARLALARATTPVSMVRGLRTRPAGGLV